MGLKSLVYRKIWGHTLYDKQLGRWISYYLVGCTHILGGLGNLAVVHTHQFLIGNTDPLSECPPNLHSSPPPPPQNLVHVILLWSRPVLIPPESEMPCGRAQNADGAKQMRLYWPPVKLSNMGLECVAQQIHSESYMYCTSYFSVKGSSDCCSPRSSLKLCKRHSLSRGGSRKKGVTQQQMVNTLKGCTQICMVNLHAQRQKMEGSCPLLCLHTQWLTPHLTNFRGWDLNYMYVHVHVHVGLLFVGFRCISLNGGSTIVLIGCGSLSMF